MSRCASRRQLLLLRWRHPASTAGRIRPRWSTSGGFLPPMKGSASGNHVSSLLPPIEKIPGPLLQTESNSVKPNLQRRKRRKRTLLEKRVNPKKPPESVTSTKSHMTPKALVDKWYAKRHGGGKQPGVIEATFEEELEPGAVKVWRTCNLTCPITGITTEAGSLRECDQSEMKIVEGKQYYDAGKIARQAAAARLWDSIRYSETNESEPRLCEEEPIKLPKEFFLNESQNSLRTTPLNLVNNLFHPLGVTIHGGSDCFKVIDTLHGFTATFTCPLTGHTVESGALKPASWKGHVDYKVVDGKVYYDSEQFAKQAASARFVDDLKYSQTGESEYRLCEEPPLTIEDIDKKWIKRTDSRASAAKASDQDERKVPDNPKSVLSAIYDELQNPSRDKSLMRIGLNVTKMQSGWTASFQCPITGHLVHSGRWRERSKYKESNGAICYENYKNAEHAAVARFLDDMTFSKTGEVEPRLCEEMPSTIENVDKLLEQRHKATEAKQDSLSLKNRFRGIYKLFGGKKAVEEGLVTEKTEHGYTAAFTSPIADVRHVVKSGRLRTGYDYKVVGESVYYGDEEGAKRSVLARLVDDVSYSKFGKLRRFFCEEEPTEIENFGLILYPGKGAYRIVLDIYRSLPLDVVRNATSSSLRSKNVWTSTFTCPVTGHIVEAGTLKNSQDVLTYDSKAYYSIESKAKMAALGRFLDNFWYTQTGKVEPRWCEEAPSLIDADGIEKLFMDPSREKGYIISTEGKTKQSRNTTLSPKFALKDMLRKAQIDFDEIMITTSSLADSKWTATFTCPLTGLKFNAGTLRTSKDARFVNGHIIYNNERGAEMAAAARYLDDLRFTQTGETEPRWCEEAPTQINADGIQKLFMDDESEQKYVNNILNRPSPWGRSREDGVSKQPVLVSSTTEVMKSKELDRSESDIVTEPQEVDGSESDIRSSSVSHENVAQWKHTKDIDDNDDDDELVIRDVPAFSSAGFSPLDRIMDVWSETVATNKSLPVEGNGAYIGRVARTNPIQHKERVIAETVLWHERLRKQTISADQVFRVFQISPVTIKSATAALRALSKAHWNHPSQDIEMNQRVEDAATKMIDLMWSSGSPSIEGYNYYLQCLIPSGSTSGGHMAEEIFRAMVDRNELDGRLLPEPNTRTFNTLIQSCALSGGDAADSKCRDIFDMIEEAEEMNFDVQPDRDTILSGLSSLARPGPSGVSAFNGDRARWWIDQMQKMREESDDSSFMANTQVYNAPLRWSGGAESSRTRPYTQGLPWDRHSEIFSEGFRTLQESDPLWIEARRIEEWMLEMQTDGVEPDVETFEAAVQAWSRTGTSDGLRKAEELLNRALVSDKVRLRFQSFHPVLAAWAYLGDESSLDKLDEWSERLERECIACPELKPDERMDLAKLIAKRKAQKRILSQGGNEAISMASEIAESCTRDLDDLVDKAISDSSVVLDPTTFSHALSAWGDVALSKAASESVRHEAAKKMLGVVKKYDKALQHWLSKLREGQVDSLSTLGKMDPQLQQLLQYFQTVYLNALSILDELDQNQGSLDNSLGESSTFYSHFFAVEAMLRRSQELRQMLSSSLNESESTRLSPDDISLQYIDEYTYPASVSDSHFDKTFLEKQIALYSTLVNCCNRILKSDCFGDSIKLVMLIVCFVEQSSSIPKSHRQEAVDCTNLYCAILNVVQEIPNENDRHEALRRVFSNVNYVSDKEEDKASPFTINKDVILTILKADSRSMMESASTKSKSKGVRPRRLKRQRWRTASRSF